ncbi:MAG: hypothetical protein HRT61_00235 [Ekhidna sp.]|nr:hypothetical protein [Ekhidna sp.]
MKKLLVMVAATLVSVAAFSQMEFTPKVSKGGGFDVSAGIDSGEAISIGGEVHKVFETEGGSKYIKCTSPKTGNEYAVWIGVETSHEYDGYKVYQMKSGAYCIYKVSVTSGNPYPVYLSASEG